MNRNYKIGMVAAAIAAIMIAIPVYLYWAYGTLESMYRRGIATPFWTTLKNGTETIVIRQDETKTVGVELHYWKELQTALGLNFEQPETEKGGLYNAPDGLEISFNLDDAYIHVDKGKITNIMSHRDVKLKQPSEIEQLFESAEIVVAEVGNVSVSVSKEVPPGSYDFGLGTSDAQINSKYEPTSQFFLIVVAENDDEIKLPASKMVVTSVEAYTLTHGLIGEIVPDMEFKKGVNVLLNASFTNPSTTESVRDFMMTLGIRDDNNDPLPDDISFVTGDSVMPGGTITVEHSWIPSKIGNYKVMIFSMTKSELGNTIPSMPAAAIPIRVVD